jgi:hypothetical protein
MVVDKPKEAEQVLSGLHTLVQTREVLVLDLPNQAGALAKVAEQLTHAGINIEYAYCTSSKPGETGRLILRTNNLEETINALS